MRCAAVGPPPGGPEDKTPPALVSISPPSGTTSVEGSFTFELTFSERLHEETNLSALRVSPAIQEPLDVRLNREVLSVTFPDELADGQTYILTVTRDLMDERKNRLDRTYQIAFSTGGEIASGTISGTIHSMETGSSALVYLFSRGESADDSLLLGSPHYYTETDDSGRYTFDYLDPGRYTPVAHKGGSPPSPISPSRNVYGLFWDESVVMDDSTLEVDDVNIFLGREVGPFRVLLVEMDDAVSGTVGFSNPFDLTDAPDTKMSFLHAESGTKMPVRHLFQLAGERKTFRFFSEGLKAGDNYAVSVTGLRDSLEQVLEQVNRNIRVPETDPLPPSIHFPQPNQKIRVEPKGPPLVLQFTKPIRLVDGDSTIVLTETSAGSVKTVLTVEESRIDVTPENGWSERSSYRDWVL